jgi:nitroimidazol reductase NimA-like FMN-containing flavoprotein (pyridoxamine 5'-phosphate oxidase superfamily)
MLIREMSREECLQVLAGARVARLACAHENQPYVVPVSLACQQPWGEEACLYGFTTPGQKLEWMRTNPQVCVEVDDISSNDQWVSVVATGRYEELPETPGSAAARLAAPGRARQIDKAMPPWPAGSRQLPCEDDYCEDKRERAWQVVQTHPMWWEPASTSWSFRTHGDPGEPFTPIYYRIRIDKVTGREATRDANGANLSTVPAPLARKPGWLRSTLLRLFGRAREVSAAG